MQEPKWYVIHTRTGYENKVKADLEKTVENRNLQDLIVEIKVPTEDVVEVKNGKRKTTQHRIYPCYIMVKMVMTSETWYVVRNASGVTGFVGSGSEPVPLTDDEVAMMGVERKPVILDIFEGDTVRIISGTFDNFIGMVKDIDRDKQKMHVMVNMFGREMPVEVEFLEVVKV